VRSRRVAVAQDPLVAQHTPTDLPVNPADMALTRGLECPEVQLTFRLSCDSVDRQGGV